MPNFSFLQSKTEYALFAPACVEAEKIFASAPTLCAVGCRKALKLGDLYATANYSRKAGSAEKGADAEVFWVR